MDGLNCTANILDTLIMFRQVLLNILSHSVFFAFLLFTFPDPAYDLGNGAYQEMKAEVTEVPASQLIPEGSPNFTGTVWVLICQDMGLIFSGS